MSTYAPNIGNIDDVLNLMPVLQLQVPMATALFRAFCDPLTPQPTKATQATAPATTISNDYGFFGLIPSLVSGLRTRSHMPPQRRCLTLPDTRLHICMHVDFLFLFSLPVHFTLAGVIKAKSGVALTTDH